MGVLFLERLDRTTSDRAYACRHCCKSNKQHCSVLGSTSIVHLASPVDLISKGFHGRNGPAYLFKRVVNVVFGDRVEERQMTSGRHHVQDVFCSICHNNIGWKYIRSFDACERYKEGKVVLERLQLIDIITHADLSVPLLGEEDSDAQNLEQIIDTDGNALARFMRRLPSESSVVIFPRRTLAGEPVSS
ncbi:hypothetical protein M9434_004301 [Picochlorum sp. BPE23]|nr:hypothetical protein M9435_002398 [Picochlorum sp. BPE23]KAI8110725.1 hypothetical protein M9434_004301 [Picochlorum sp. BPE23]|mmetsp:Transcript_4869/g.9701  ORF Transcript_4869/g.9701 Transcript_4869/m.9701 type:complete len:189 (+) Transcript_4869:220-786(+)